MSISVPIIVRNTVKNKYPLDLVAKSVVGLASEIVISVCPNSIDDSVDYVYDLVSEINSRNPGLARYIESVWDLNNVNDQGTELSRQTNIAIEACTKDWILSLQADECCHEQDFGRIRNLIREADQKDIDGYAMTRLYFYGDIETLRTDWEADIVRLYRKGSRISCGDGMNTEGSSKVIKCDVPIYHYSRIGDPDIISKRILALDKLFHPSEILIDESELKPYKYDTHNFDCMAKDGDAVGRRKVPINFRIYTGSHPALFKGYKG